MSKSQERVDEGLVDFDLGNILCVLLKQDCGDICKWSSKNWCKTIEDVSKKIYKAGYRKVKK